VSTHTREALDAVGGGAFVQKIIDPVVVDIQRRYSPLLAAIPTERWTSDVYYFNRRTRLPAGGWVRDGGARPVASGTYDQRLWQMKHLQGVGDVTNYAEVVTAAQAGSLRGKEIEGTYKGLAWDLETACVYGNAEATANGPDPHFSGFDTLISDFSGSGKNAIDVNGNFALTQLDQLIDMVEVNLSESIAGPDWMFVGSSTLVSKVGQALLAQQRYMQVDIAPGLNVLSYRDVPMVKSSFLAPRSITMGTVTFTTATTGGVLPNASVYNYRIAAVIARSGETIASASVAATTGATTGTHVLDLSFSTPTGYESAGPILYKVYRTAAAGGAGTETLLGVVDAVVALGADGVTRVPTTKIRDTGAALVPMNGSTTPGTLPTTYFGGNTAKMPLAANQETIYLVPRNRDYMLRPYVREMQPLPLAATVSSPDSSPFAVASDSVLAIRDPRMIGALQRVTVSL
jgi:hypothetical protein